MTLFLCFRVLMHLSTASPGGATPGHTKGKERNIGELQTEFPPGYRGNKEVCFCLFGRGKEGGIFDILNVRRLNFVQARVYNAHSILIVVLLYIQKTIASEIQVCIESLLFLLFVYCIMFLNYF